MISLKCLKARFKEKEEKKLDFPHDEECPKMFGISNIVSHIRMESKVAWDDPRPDIWRTDSGPKRSPLLSIKVVSYVSCNFKVVVKCKAVRFPFMSRSLENS